MKTEVALEDYVYSMWQMHGTPSRGEIKVPWRLILNLASALREYRAFYDKHRKLEELKKTVDMNLLPEKEYDGGRSQSDLA